MNFLEKDLENYLWTEPTAAYFDGFNSFCDFAFGCPIQRFRQPQLGPYGIADLVHIVHQNYHTILIQVIECKRHTVTLSAYAQAKRYTSALKFALAGFLSSCAASGITVKWECILVGDKMEESGDFTFVFNEDPECKIYTYTVNGTRLHFEKVHKGYGYHSASGCPLFTALEAKVYNYVEQAHQQIEADILESRAFDEKMKLDGIL